MFDNVCVLGGVFSVDLWALLFIQFVFGIFCLRVLGVACFYWRLRFAVLKDFELCVVL